MQQFKKICAITKNTSNLITDWFDGKSAANPHNATKKKKKNLLHFTNNENKLIKRAAFSQHKKNGTQQKMFQLWTQKCDGR